MYMVKKISGDITVSVTSKAVNILENYSCSSILILSDEETPKRVLDTIHMFQYWKLMLFNCTKLHFLRQGY